MLHTEYKFKASVIDVAAQREDLVFWREVLDAQLDLIDGGSVHASVEDLGISEHDLELLDGLVRHLEEDHAPQDADAFRSTLPLNTRIVMVRNALEWTSDEAELGHGAGTGALLVLWEEARL